MAFNFSLGDIIARISADIGPLNKALAVGQKRLAAFANEMSGKLGVAGQALAALGPAGIAVATGLGALTAAAGAAAAAIKISVSKVSELSDQLNTLSQRTGLSTTTLQELGFAAALSGTSMDAMSGAVTRMQKGLTDGDTSFQRLGLSLQNLQGMAPDQAFLKVADAIRNIQDPAIQAAAAMDIFGKSGTHLLPAIKSGLAEAAQKARELGIVLSEQDVRAAADLKSQTDTLTLAWDGLVNQFGSAIIESGTVQQSVEDLTRLISDMSKVVQDNKVTIAEWATALTDSIRGLLTLGGSVSTFMKEHDAIRRTLEQTWKLTGLSLLAQYNNAVLKALANKGKAAREASAAQSQKPYEADVLVAQVGPGYVTKAQEGAAKSAQAEADRIAAIRQKLADQIEEITIRELEAVEALRQQDLADFETEQLAKRAAFEASMEAMGASAERSADDVRAALEDLAEDEETEAEAEKFAKSFQGQMESMALKAGEVVGILSQMGGLLEALGMSADSGIGRAVAGLTDLAKAGQQGATAFAQFSSGDIMGGISSSIGAITNAIGGLKKLFGGKSQLERDAERLGQMLGEKISKGLSEQISKTAKDLGVGLQEAMLLNLDAVLAETGNSVAEMSDEVFKLMEGIALGGIPAKEGMEQLSNAFNQARDEATGVGDAMTVAMLKAAQATGTMTDEMKAFVSEQNNLMASGAGKIAAGMGQMDLSKMTSSFGENAALFFASGFTQAIAEQGLMGALDSLGEQALEMFEQLSAAGNEAGAKLLEPFANLQKQLGGNEQLTGMMETLSGMGDIFEGAANQGLLTADMTAAFGEQMAEAFAALQAGGVDAKTSMTAIMPELLKAVQAAEQMGVPLDANTQALKDQAEAMGFAFPADPLIQLVDLMKSLVQGMGFDLPASAQNAATGMNNAAQAGTAAMNNMAQQTSQAALTASTAFSGSTQLMSEQYNFLADDITEAAEYWSSQVNAQTMELPTFATTATTDTLGVYQAFSDNLTDPNGPLSGAKDAVDDIARAWQGVANATKGAQDAANNYTPPGGGGNDSHDSTGGANSVPGYAGGTKGFKDFGSGTLVELHGREAVVTAEDAASGTLGGITVINNIYQQPGQSPEQLASAMVIVLRRNLKDINPILARTQAGKR